jgi:hypothetical protein
MKDKKNPHRITLIVTDRELEILGFIINEEGQKNISLVIHDCILNYYKSQYFNKQYMRKGKIIEEAPESILSPEAHCEKWGGRVIRSDDGTMKCSLSVGGDSGYVVPLSMPDRIEEVSKRYNIR